MAIARGTGASVRELLGFCRTQQFELDASFLYDEGLRDFRRDETPTPVALGKGGAMIGAASVMNTP